MNMYGNQGMNNVYPTNNNGMQNNYMNNQAYYQKPFDIADYVNGFNGAANYPVPTGCTGVLLDFNIGKMWIKSPGGTNPMEEFDIKRCAPVVKNQNESISREEFESSMNGVNESLAKLTEMITGLQSGGLENKYNKVTKTNNQKG